MPLWIEDVWDFVRDNLGKVLGVSFIGSLLTIQVVIHCAGPPPEEADEDGPPSIAEDDPGFEEVDECERSECISVLIPRLDTVGVLQDDFWKYESYNMFESGEEIGPEFASRIRGRSFYNSAEAIVSVGMASEEGELEIEWRRAVMRAFMINKFIVQQTDKTTYKLLLGQHLRRTGKSDTFDQRRALVLGIRGIDKGMDIGDIERLICSAIDGEYDFGLRVNDYQGCDLQSG